jgi:hypothetical protein
MNRMLSGGILPQRIGEDFKGPQIHKECIHLARTRDLFSI